jgi:hypothetical protein
MRLSPFCKSRGEDMLNHYDGAKKGEDALSVAELD